ncbi:MAG: peptidase domain-containing ABC transporter [Gammaproteobacteria bacterium]|jgi:ATP-binding cassette subfamily B protein RaxB|nr:peptidase domain-containing ABC transporter [Gammaproteobacteria bacterium]
MSAISATIATRLRHPGSKHLPVIQQNELAECGLACLAMVANYHGHAIDLASLRRRFSISLKGMSMSSLINMAGKLGFDTRPLRVELDYLRQLQTPCILHWNLNHFVVLKRAGKNQVQIHDPANGARTVTMDEVSRRFTGIALELQPAADFSPIQERRSISLRALAGRVRGLGTAVTQVLLLALLLELFTLALPLAMQWVLDEVLVTADINLLHLLGIGFMFVVAFQALTTALRGWIIAGIGASISAQWIANLFSHLLKLPLEFFEKRQVGQVMSRFFSVQHIQQTLTGSFIEALLDGLTITLIVLVLAIYSLPLTLLVLTVFALYALLRLAAYRRLYLLNEEQLSHSANQQSQIIETLHGMQAIKLANQQSQRHARVLNATIEVANRDALVQRLSASFNALSRFLFGGQRVLLIWIGAWMALQGGFTAGMLVVFVAYADMFATRGGTLIDRLIELRLLKLHGQRIADIALEPPEANTSSNYSGEALQPRLQVEQVCFRYGDDEPWVLQQCCMCIEAGESVAIIGPSGCGKSTLAKILLGLLQPVSGTIKIDGIDIYRYGLDNYRELFGAVMQDDVLFAGSIADNISFFDSAASMEQIVNAAKSAQIHDDINAMPMGYETLVGDMGSALSGGQKQRVLLARALYRQPKILLLDEATSHLDIKREKAINSAIKNLNMTRIVIAHRPDTIASADRVILLRDSTAEQQSNRDISKDVSSNKEFNDLQDAATAAGQA